ncbi:MAG: hypothetical protein QXO98_00680 [Sulfolobales archaeon]
MKPLLTIPLTTSNSEFTELGFKVLDIGIGSSYDPLKIGHRAT